MTQTSRPAATDVTTWPNSDAGPYTADQWAQMFQTLFTGDQQATQGPLIRYLNELQGSVQTPGATPVLRVVTGAAMVNGHWFESDANVDFTVVAPTVNPRIDIIVVAVNNTAVDFAVSDAGFTLDFPDNLVDYGADADIEEYSCRLCIVQGVENAAPAVPGLDANNNHWMIPLYQYQIAVGGGTSNETDRRDFCEFSTDIPDLTILTAMIDNLAVTTGKIAANAVDDTKLRDSAATSVIGKAGAGVGDPADIVAGVNDRVFAQAAGTLSFQQVATGMIADEAVTLAKLAHFAGFDVIGKIGAGAGDPASIVAGADTVLAKLGAGNVAFQAIVPALVTDRTRKFFVQCSSGRDATAATDLVLRSSAGIEMIQTSVAHGYANFMVPNDFVSGMTVTAVIIPAGAGDVMSRNGTHSYGACGEAFNVHTNTSGQAAITVAANERECIQALALANAAVGDIVSLAYEREATDVGDTVAASVYFSGWIVEYTADS